MAEHLAVTPELLGYVRQVSLRDDDILRGLRDETAQLPAGKALQVMAEEAQLLALLVALTGARTVLDIGTYTGYSALCMARALPPGGLVVTCDVTDRWPDIGAPYWKRAGVEDRIELRVADARRTIGELLTQRGPDSFDLAFVDADKTSYREYYEGALSLVRPGGLVVLDNTLYFGRVVDPAAQDPETRAIREINTFLRHDERVDVSLVVMADGITLARKRPRPQSDP